MRHLRWTVPLATSLSLFGASSALAVPTLQLTPNYTVTRVTSDGKPYGCPERQAQTGSCIVDGTSQGIGYFDCVDDTKLRFSLQMTGVPDPNYSLQVWAGTTDCTAQGATNNATTGTCWKVANDPQMTITISPLDIRVADIVAHLNQSPPLPQNYTGGVDATTSCNNARSATSTTTTTVTDDAGTTTAVASVSTVTIYFLVFQSGNYTTPAAQASFPVKVKLVGPNPVSNLTAKSGDGEIILDWTPPTGDLTVQGFDLFAVAENTTVGDGGTTTTCSDASTQLLDDAGNPVLDDAGNPVLVPDDAGCTTTSNSSTATCAGDSGVGSVDVSSISCPTGEDAGADAGVNVVCHVVSGVTTNSGTISGLSNNQSYVATVAAFDQYGNTGQTPTSAVCNKAAPIDDFWKVYNQEGGNAYCALEVVGKRGGSVAAALLALVGMIWIRRRRR